MAPLVPSFFIGFSFVQVSRTCFKAWISLNFHQILQLSMELTALERLKKFFYFFLVAIDGIVFNLQITRLCIIS